MPKTRILLGLAVMVLIQIGSGELLSLLGVPTPAYGIVQTVLITFIAAFTGGVIARRRFLLPALTLWLLIWAAITYILYGIAAPNGNVSVISILQQNVVGIVLSLVATAAGALSGQFLRANRSRVSAAAT